MNDSFPIDRVMSKVDHNTINLWMNDPQIRRILIPWAVGDLTDAQLRDEWDLLHWREGGFGDKAWATFFYHAGETKELARLAALARIGE